MEILARMNSIVVFFLVALSPSTPLIQNDAVSGKGFADSTVTFGASIAPLLKANCTPCHFPGGVVFEKYPFEDYETVFALRKKLGTRLKEPEQQALLARWLEGGARQ